MTSDMTSRAFPPAYAHDPIERIGEDVFMVRGCIPMKPAMRISRNMAIVKHGEDLMLVNPLRLDAATERALDALGTVRWVLRLGAMHGVDDPYYVARYAATFCAQPGGTHYSEPSIDLPIAADTSLPIPNTTIIPIAGSKQPECALLVRRGDGLLLTCDAVQHYGDYSHNTWLARLVMPLIGLPKKTIVGPMWLKFMTPKGTSLQSSFEALLDHEFDALLSAHGTFLPNGAKAAVQSAISEAFG